MPSIFLYMAVVDRRVMMIIAARKPAMRPVKPHRMTLQIANGGMRKPTRTPRAMPTTRMPMRSHGSHVYVLCVKV